jgi:multiple sugar transport system substrate-binding protein
MMSAGTPPDVFYLPPDTFPAWASMDLIRPVDDLIQKDIAQGGAKTKALYDDFFPILMNAYRYDNATGKIGSGPLYGLPKDMTTAVFYVNLDLFAKAGVRVPYEGWTWDEFEQTCKKITALSNTPGFEGRKIYGASFDLWSDTLRQILWSFGGDFFGPGGFRDVALDQPAAQEALEFIRRSRFDDKFTYNNTGVSTEGKQEFYSGNIGCVGPYGRWMTPRYASISTFKWDVVPVPYKEKKDHASQVFYTAWAMSSKTPYPKEAFKLIKFLCGGEGAAQQSRLGLGIPPLKSVAHSIDFLEPADVVETMKQASTNPDETEIRQRLRHQGEIFLGEVPYARLQQVPRDSEFWSRLIDNKSKRSLVLAEESTMANAREIKALWLNELNSPLRQKDW